MRRLILTILILTLFLAACGKKGPLVYPDMLVPAPVGNFSVLQFEMQMRVSMTIPERDLAGRALQDLSGIKIFKRAEPANSLKRDDCAACLEGFRLYRTWLIAKPEPAEIIGKNLIFFDNEVSSSMVYSYYAVPVTTDGTEGQQSAMIHALRQTPPPPPAVRAVSTIAVIRIEVIPPAEELPSLVGYNLYRAPKGEKFPLFPVALLQPASLTYSDNSAERNIIYQYAVRSLLKTKNGFVEGFLSEEATGMLKNDED